MKKISIIALFMCLFIPNIVINAWSEYKVGQEVEYNGINFYVIKNSGTKEDSVTMLKAEPLTVEEVNLYGGVGTANNHVNMYVTTNTSAGYYQTAYNVNNSGYGGMAYYSSSTCNGSGDSSGCTTNYADSEIKYVVDAWKTAQAPNATNARLITLDDLRDNLGIELTQSNATSLQITVTEDTPTWVMGENYYYWTMTTNTDKTADVWDVRSRSTADVGSDCVQYHGYAVRPVITLSKVALGDTNDIESDETENKDTKEIISDKQDNNKKEISTKVSVANTYLKTSIIIILLGFISAGIGIFIFYKISNKKK